MRKAGMQTASSENYRFFPTSPLGISAEMFDFTAIPPNPQTTSPNPHIPIPKPKPATPLPAPKEASGGHVRPEAAAQVSAATGIQGHGHLKELGDQQNQAKGHLEFGCKTRNRTLAAFGGKPNRIQQAVV